jgi:hypothetical protein
MNKKLINNWKKIKYFLEKYDGIWSIPLSISIFYFSGYILSEVFGTQTGTYDPGFIQPLFLSATIVIGAVNVGVIGLYFTIRGFHNFIYGKKDKNSVTNQAKVDWVKLTPWERFKITLFSLAFLIALVIIVYLKLI